MFEKLYLFSICSTSRTGKKSTRICGKKNGICLFSYVVIIEMEFLLNVNILCLSNVPARIAFAYHKLLIKKKNKLKIIVIVIN